MKVSLSWLKAFLPLTQTASEIACHLTNLGIEVESISGHEATFSGVIVGKILHAEKHPDADRLKVAHVTDGAQDYQVVCGGSNCREGIVVAFAKEGACLTDENGKKWKIKKSKIRDIESSGMLCTWKELQLSEESEGIIELPASTPLGMDFSAVALDPVFDLSLTPNLGHCYSILGIARELAACLKLKIGDPPHLVSLVSRENALGRGEGSEIKRVEIEDPTLCPRYTCCMMTGIRVGPSPAWMQEQLTKCGLRPINNIVDISNYVMLEQGQPLHIFDSDHIAGPKLIVKLTPSPFSFQTLDQKSREIPSGTLFIYDEEKPLDLAGIMGGLDSAVTEKTVNILIEAAVFAPSTIRKTSRLLDLKTDASNRFSRGIDEEGVIRALNRATELIYEIAGGTIHPIVDEYPSPSPKKKIHLRPEKVNQIIGFHLSKGEMIDLLKRLEMRVTPHHNDLMVEVPSYRNDVHIEADLIEEIARLYGYHLIPKAQPVYTAGSLLDSPLFTLEQEVRSILLREGLQECITCDLISPAENALTREKEMSDAATLSVLHPRSMDQSILRTSLLPGMIKVAQQNFNFQQTDLALFEIGRVHYKEGEAIAEPTCAALLLSGLSRPAHFDRKPSPFDFLDLKGMIENLFDSLHLNPIQFHPSYLHAFHPWRQAHITLRDRKVGVLGEVHPDLIRKSNLHGRIFFAEINVSDILELKTPSVRFRPLAPYPSSTRDWTLTISTHLPYGTVADLIKSYHSPYLESFEMIDSFSSKELGPDRKNVTFRFIYRDRHQTIGYPTVEEEHRKLTSHLQNALDDFIPKQHL